MPHDRLADAYYERRQMAIHAYTHPVDPPAQTDIGAVVKVFHALFDAVHAHEGRGSTQRLVLSLLQSKAHSCA